jgi:Zn-dependent protease with chaperone function
MTHLFIIVVLVSLSLAGGFDTGLVRGVPAWFLAAMVAAPYAVLAAVASLATGLCVRRLDRRGDPAAVRWSHRVLSGMRLLGLAWHLVTVFGLGLLPLVRSATGDLVLVDELLAAAPALGLLLFSFRLAHPVEARLRAAMLVRELDEGRPIYAFPPPWRYVLATARNNAAIMALPLTLILGWSEALDRIVAATGIDATTPSATLLIPVVQIVGALTVFALIPPVMVRVWDTVPVPRGELRDGLEQLARGHRVRVRDFLIWRTGGAMLNGAVIGLTPWLRYIVLTDSLLDHLPEREVEAVAAHEVAHVRKRHMLWLAVAVLGSAMLLGETAELIARAIGLGPASSAWAVGAVSLAGVLMVLGLVSRRFEWQADAFAARHLTGTTPVVTHEAAEAMSSALARVSRLNGMPERRFTWRHGSIAARRTRLERLIGLPPGRLPIDRQVRVLMVLAAVAFASGAALSAANLLQLGPFGPIPLP